MKVPFGDQGLYVLETAAWRTYKPVIDKEKCIDCGFCLIYCPVNSFYKEDKSVQVDLSYCKGCGICVQECPKKAIDWVKEDK